MLSVGWIPLACIGVCGCKFDHDQTICHAKAILMASDMLQMADFACAHATTPLCFQAHLSSRAL